MEIKRSWKWRLNNIQDLVFEIQEYFGDMENEMDESRKMWFDRTLRNLCDIYHYLRENERKE